MRLRPGTRLDHPVFGLGTVQDERDRYGWTLVVFDSGERLYLELSDLVEDEL